MPEVTAGMTQMMIDIFNAFPPLMTAIERNQVLSKASNSSRRKFKSRRKN
ncbi:MAG: hypothetical protein ACLU99_08545 [Alphaproteobacteria bacterium]